jgi:UDP-glucose 4-epimerase
MAPVFGPAKLGETREIYLDAAKAGKILNWKPSTSLKQGLEQTVAYFAEKEVNEGKRN